MLALGFLTAVVHAECGDRSALLDELDRQVLEGRFEQAEVTKRSIVLAFGCGPLADPAHVARLWLAEAVMLAARDDERSNEMFAAAARLSPGTWTPIYGPTLQQRWEEAARLPVPAPGTVRIELLAAEDVAALDGTWQTFPVAVASGPHLLQVGATGSEMASALRFDLPPGIDLVLDPKLPSVPTPPAAVANRDVRGRRILHALLLGGASAAVYSATFATNAAFYAPKAAERSEGLRALNDGLVIGSAVTGTVSAVMLVRGIAAPPRTAHDTGS